MKAGNRKFIGSYPMGAISVDVWVDPGRNGGSFCTDGAPWAPPERGQGRPTIELGLRDKSIGDITSTLLHEAFELYCSLRGHRYDTYPSYGNSMDAFVFILRHPDLSECMGCVGMLVSGALPLIAREYQKFNKAQG